MRRIFISILTTMVVMSMMLNSCSGISVDLPDMQEQIPDEPVTPEFREGTDLTVTIDSTPVILFPSDVEEMVEIPFTISPVVETLKYEVVVSVPSVVSTEVVMTEDNTGGVVRVTTVGELSGLSLSLRVTEDGKYVSSNWTESENVKLEPYRLVLSHHERETQPSGTNHGEFRVTSNVGFDPVVDKDCSDWLSVVGIEDGYWVIMDIKENTTDKNREGHIKVWDSGHRVYETFTVIQKCSSMYDKDGDDFYVGVGDEVDGGDHHIIY